MTPEDPSPKSAGIFVTGLAQRANEVLRRMELISSPTIQQFQLKSWKSDELDEDIVQVGSYQNVYHDYPRHLAFSKVALPIPTRAIYNMVLRSYAKEEGHAHVPEQAEDVTWSMIQRVMQLPHLNSLRANMMRIFLRAVPFCFRRSTIGTVSSNVGLGVKTQIGPFKHFHLHKPGKNSTRDVKEIKVYTIE